jgi:hypothetical protein
VFLQSCEKDNDSVDSSSQTFLGKQSTVRNYETTTWQYEANSNVPLVKTPASLYRSLSIDSMLILQGVVMQTTINETLIPYDISWAIVSNPSLYSAGVQVKTTTELYDLNTELQCISNKRTYSNSINQSIDGAIYFENGEIFDVIFGDNSKNTVLIEPLSIGVNWIRESYHYKNNKGGIELFQQDCRVISQEQVEVKAGKFLAYKIEIMNNWIDLKSKSLRGYEYYVPEVGLILEESDSNVYQTSISLSGDASTIYFRQKYRKELVSYNFIKK